MLALVIARLFLGNKFSGAETVELIQRAFHAGAAGMDELQGAAAQGRCMQNARRDLLRHFLKHTTMPALYWAKIPLWNDSTLSAEEEWFPFLLPHEVFVRLLQSDSSARPMLHFLSPEMVAIRDKLCRDLGIDPEEFIGVGIFGDGVPHSKKKTVECFSWNFIAEPDAQRILCTCVEKQFCCQCGCGGRLNEFFLSFFCPLRFCFFFSFFFRHTTDKLLEVLCWSFRCMILGQFPKKRHDGTQWISSDASRKALKGSLGSKGGLMQIRGDWALSIH